MAQSGSSGRVVYVPNQQHRHHTGAQEKCKIASLIPGMGKQNLQLTRIPRKFILYTVKFVGLCCDKSRKTTPQKSQNLMDESEIVGISSRKGEELATVPLFFLFMDFRVREWFFHSNNKQIKAMWYDVKNLSCGVRPIWI